MAAKAFLLIVTAPGKSREVVTSLSKLKGIISVDTVTGPYDTIAVLQGELNLSDVGDLVGKINSMAGVSRSVICLVI